MSHDFFRPLLAIGVGAGGTGALGGLWAAATIDGASGTLVAVGGVAVVAYGIWCASRERVTQDAYRRERQAVQRLDEMASELETVKLERAMLKARVAYCEANHDPITPQPR